MGNFNSKILSCFTIGFLIFIPVSQAAERDDVHTIVISDHSFSPQELVVPAQQKIKLIVENQDPTAEEFESYDLNREKIVGGKSSVTLYVGPLKPGVYKYFGEFHQSTAQGTIVAQ